VYYHRQNQLEPSLFQDKFAVGSISLLSFVQLFTILLLKPNRMYNIYKACVSPRSAQQTMPYF
jgi:hypothetical protein